MSKLALLYCLITVIAWGVASVLDKVMMRELSPWAAVFARMIIGTAIVGAYAVGSGALGELRGVSVGIWAALVGSALLGSLIGQVAYYSAMRHADASSVVPITATYPLVGAMLAIGLLREPLTASKVGGALLVVAGIILLSGAFGQQNG